MVDGTRIHRVMGLESDGVTRTQCEEFIEQKRSEARAGRLALPKGRKLALTFAAAAERYLQRLEESGGKNIRIKRRQLRMHLVPNFGSLRLDAITEFSVATYKKRRVGQGAANATINRELAVLSHLFYSAQEWRWLDRVPVRLGKHKLPEGDGRIIALTDEECDALLKSAIAGGNPDLWLFVAFGLNTAMRHDEIMCARWDELDLAHWRLFIPKAKGGKRTQPITPELALILEREREMRDDREGWIFPSPHADTAAGHRTRMDRPFAEAVARSGLDPALVRRMSCGTRRSPSWSRPRSISRRFRRSAATRVWRWCCAMCTCTGSTSTREFGRSAAACRRAIRCHRRTTERAIQQPLPNTITQELHRGRRGGSRREQKRTQIRGEFQRDT
jgi:integrase